MSSLGFAMAFMICVPDGGPCETVALRASRFADAQICQAAIPEAMRASGRVRSDGRQLMAACRSLDEICGGAHAAAAPAVEAAAPVSSGRWPIKDRCSQVTIQHWVTGRSSSAIEASKAILCGRPHENETRCGD